MHSYTDSAKGISNQHGPMLGVLRMGAARPTPGVLRNLVVTVGEDVKAGRLRQFGNGSWYVEANVPSLEQAR